MDDVERIAGQMRRQADWCERHHPDCDCSRILRRNAARVAQHLKQENAQ